jgi:ABC-type phosphate transport system substrate-binding protein
VNLANPVHDITLAELRKIYLADQNRWDDGKPVYPVIPESGAPVRAAFLRIVCGMRDADFRKYFLQATFTGKDLTAPHEVNTTAGMKKVVASSPGAIGFIRAIDFHGDGSDGGIKAVRVNGFLASDLGYKLRM